MADMTPQAQGAATHGPGHEPMDVPFGKIFGFGIGLVVVAVVVHLVLAGMMKSFENRERRLQALRPARYGDPTGQFPLPNLQGNPGRDLVEFKEQEHAKLDAYGWADKKAGVAQIPIERAMDILLEKGLPARPQPKDAQGAGSRSQ